MAANSSTCWTQSAAKKWKKSPGPPISCAIASDFQKCSSAGRWNERRKAFRRTGFSLSAFALACQESKPDRLKPVLLLSPKQAHNLCMNQKVLAEKICATLRRHGHQAFLVGGCVRDLLLGREPADYDVCTDARPDRVLELFPRSLTVGARFGVILVVEEMTQV